METGTSTGNFRQVPYLLANSFFELIVLGYGLYLRVMHGQHVIYGYNAGFVIIVVSLHMRVDLLDNVDALGLGLRSRSFAAGRAACSVSQFLDLSSLDW